PFRQPNRRRRLLVAHSRRLRRPWSDEEMICDEELERHRHRHVGRDDESPGFERMTNKTSGASRKSYPQARDERLLDREWLPSGSIRCAVRHSQTIAAVAGVGCCKFSIEGDHAYCDVDLPSGLDVDIKKKLVKEVAECLHHAYMIPDNRVFLREWPGLPTRLVSTVNSVAQCPPSVLSSSRQGYRSRRSASSSTASASQSPRHAVCHERTSRSRAARRSAPGGCSDSSANTRLTKLLSMTSWRSRIRWFSKAWRQPCKQRRGIRGKAGGRTGPHTPTQAERACRLEPCSESTSRSASSFGVLSRGCAYVH